MKSEFDRVAWVKASNGTWEKRGFFNPQEGDEVESFVVLEVSLDCEEPILDRWECKNWVVPPSPAMKSGYPITSSAK